MSRSRWSSRGLRLQLLRLALGRRARRAVGSTVCEDQQGYRSLGASSRREKRVLPLRELFPQPAQGVPRRGCGVTFGGDQGGRVDNIKAVVEKAIENLGVRGFVLRN